MTTNKQRLFNNFKIDISQLKVDTKHQDLISKMIKNNLKAYNRYLESILYNWLLENVVLHIYEDNVIKIIHKDYTAQQARIDELEQELKQSEFEARGVIDKYMSQVEQDGFENLKLQERIDELEKALVFVEKESDDFISNTNSPLSVAYALSIKNIATKALTKKDK